MQVVVAGHAVILRFAMTNPLAKSAPNAVVETVAASGSAIVPSGFPEDTI